MRSIAKKIETGYVHSKMPMHSSQVCSINKIVRGLTLLVSGSREREGGGGL